MASTTWSLRPTSRSSTAGPSWSWSMPNCMLLRLSGLRSSLRSSGSTGRFPSQSSLSRLSSSTVWCASTRFPLSRWLLPKEIRMLYNDSNISDPNVGGVQIGDRVRWTSSAGVLRGEIVNMCLALNSAGTLVPWIDIKYTNFRGLVKTVRLCGSDDHLKMLRFRVNFRDKVAA